MEYTALMDLVCEIGYNLARSGAETYRVEESVNLIFHAYGLRSEVFSVPNNLIISLLTEDREPITRMRRVGSRVSDMDAVEKYGNLCRRICEKKPDVEEAFRWLEETKRARKTYKTPLFLLGNMFAACGFLFIFGGTLQDVPAAAICGLLVGLVSKFFEKVSTNTFFRVIITAFLLAFTAYSLGALKIAPNVDATLIATLMLLVPGLMFTNAIRDIILDDTNSGVFRTVEVLLIGAGLALGTGAAWNVGGMVWGALENAPAVMSSVFVECASCFFSCIGLAVVMNIHEWGIVLCALGGPLLWGVYRLVGHLGGPELLAVFLATFAAAVYAEAMARVRKYPALSYLVVSLFPLLPGAGIYNAARQAVMGDVAGMLRFGASTIAIAAVMAVAVLVVVSFVRMAYHHRRRKAEGKAQR